MKHRVQFRKLGRSSAHRWSMLRTMVSQLLLHERIETTLPRAKELRRLADKVITISKEGKGTSCLTQGGINAKRRAAEIVRGDLAMHRLFTVFSPRYQGRDGGYTRVLQSRQRTNDRAPMAFIEYVDRPGELRPARPPAQKRDASLLPQIAAATIQ